jgi:hypothetical protein
MIGFHPKQCSLNNRNSDLSPLLELGEFLQGGEKDKDEKATDVPKNKNIGSSPDK